MPKGKKNVPAKEPLDVSITPVLDAPAVKISRIEIPIVLNIDVIQRIIDKSPLYSLTVGREPMPENISQIETPQGVELSKVEREVLLNIALGKTTKEIAQSLGTTVRTVKFHISNMISKFQFIDPRVSRRQDIILLCKFK